jgi:O-antigen/teichoic acid export membrane protein
MGISVSPSAALCRGKSQLSQLSRDALRLSAGRDKRGHDQNAKADADEQPEDKLPHTGGSLKAMSPSGTRAQCARTHTIATDALVPFTGGVVDAGVEVVAAEPPPVAAAAVRSAATSGSGRLARNILMLGGGQLVAWFFGIAWTFVVPRRLGPAAIGEFVIAFSTAAILGIIVNQGAAPLLTREIARDHSKAPELVAGTILMRLAIAVPASLGMALYLHLVGFSGERALLIWLATAVIITAAVSGAFQAAFNGVERMEYLAYASLTGTALVSVVGITIVLLGGGIVAVVVLNLSLTLLVLVLNVYWSRRVFAVAWRQAARAVPYILRAGFVFWFGGLFFTAYLWTDSILLSLLVPAKVVGWYGVPTQLFVATLMVAGVLCTAWFPRLAAAHAEGADSLQRNARPAMQIAVVLSLPIATGVMLVATPLVAALYGVRFSGAAPVLMLLGACVVPTFFNMMAYQILRAEDRQVAWIKVVAIATVLNITANLILIPHFQAQGNGAVGAAISLLGTEIFELIAAMFLLPWLLGRRFLWRVGRAAAATALMAGVVLAVSRAGLIAEITAGLVAFGIFALLLRVPTAGELTLLRGFGARLLTRLRLRATT